MKPLAPNTLLQNRYLIVHLIGKGGMGEVYLAVDQRLGSAIALKRTLHAEDSQLGDAFEREARTLARLRHAALPKVSDHFIENDNQFLVMEHISGDDLAKRLTATQKPFPLSWVLFWADQLLDALAYLHSHEPPIIHRDIKPQNLKLTDDNNIVLLDFGLSKNSTGQTGFASGSGSTGSVVGYTPHYAPMEQIRGTGTNPRSDIYSLSATLYQLLTNVVPPDALSRADFLLSGKTDPIAPINEVNHEIPKSISDVVLKGMSISQDQRFADAREMQRILRETYAKMQSEQAEKTIAFNAQDEQPIPAAAKTTTFSNDKTEQFSAPAFDNQAASKEAMGAQTIPFGMVDSPTTKNESAPPHYAEKTEAIQNFDQTVKMDDFPKKTDAQEDIGLKTFVMPVVEESEPPQSGVKTEVFNDFRATGYLPDKETDAAPAKLETGDYNAKTDENFIDLAPNVGGDKTVPLVESEKQNAPVDLAQTQYPSAFDSIPPSVPQIDNFAATSEPQFPATDNFAATNGQGFQETAPNQYDSQPTPAAPQTPVTPAPVVQPVPEKKKSKGVLFGILGALFGLIVLAAVGGGIAYYLMNQPESSNVTNTATPTPEVTATPTPETTPDQSLVNSDTGNTSNSDLSNSDITNTNVNSAVNNTPTPVTTRTVTTPTPGTQPTRATTTPRPSTPKPATPKPEPKSTLRGTTIPQ